MDDQVVVMGVSAAGKSSVGIALAGLLGARFVDADDLHPAANVARMAAGVPLSDGDRGPWLDAVGAELAAAADHDPAGGGLVVACSALKRAYRDRIRHSAPGTFFVHLDGDPELLAARAAARTGHFMPPSLLASQLEILEPLAADEAGIRLDVADSVPELARQAAAALAEASTAEG
ncbi:MAG: gluconokinase [Leifsonia sp.]